MWNEMGQRQFWADEYDLGLTVSITRNSDPESVARCFGGDLGDAILISFDEAGERQAEFDELMHFVLFKDLGGGRILTFENFGFCGTDPDVARRCSQAGNDFMGVSWDVNARRQIVRAKNGVLECIVDPLDFVNVDSVDATLDFPDWVTAFSLPEGVSFSEASILLLEHEMGISFDSAWLQIPLRAVLVADE